MTATVTRLPTDYLASLEDDDAPERESRSLSIDVLDDTQVERLPAISWLADHIIPFGSLAAIYGPPGSGKSFVALDLALSIALGVSWLGHDVMPGGAFYLAAEGRGGLGQRVAAWKARHESLGHTLGVGFATSALNLLEPIAASRIVRTVETHSAIRSPCQLIVVDTLARSMIGDENDTGDMSRLIATVDRVRELTNATVLLVHHTRKDSDLERGSSALRGGVDTLIFCQEGDDGRQLVCQKQKDAEAFAPIPFTLAAGFGSCVVTSTGGDSPAGLTEQSSRLTPKRLSALRSLSEAFSSKGATRSEWMRATDLSDRTFYHVTAWLVREGYAAENGSRYTMTPSGKSAVATHSVNTTSANSANSPQQSPQSLTGTPTKWGSRLQQNGSSAKGPATEEGLWSDLLAEADERLGIQEES